MDAYLWMVIEMGMVDTLGPNFEVFEIGLFDRQGNCDLEDLWTRHMCGNKYLVTCQYCDRIHHLNAKHSTAWKEGTGGGMTLLLY